MVRQLFYIQMFSMHQLVHTQRKVMKVKTSTIVISGKYEIASLGLFAKYVCEKRHSVHIHTADPKSPRLTFPLKALDLER